MEICFSVFTMDGGRSVSRPDSCFSALLAGIRASEQPGLHTRGELEAWRGSGGGGRGGRGHVMDHAAAPRPGKGGRWEGGRRSQRRALQGKHAEPAPCRPQTEVRVGVGHTQPQGACSVGMHVTEMLTPCGNGGTLYVGQELQGHTGE